VLAALCGMAGLSPLGDDANSGTQNGTAADKPQRPNKNKKTSKNIWYIQYKPLPLHQQNNQTIMTTEMTSFLEDLKEVFDKHNAYIGAGFINNFDDIEFYVMVNNQTLQIDYQMGLDVEYIESILNTPQPKLKVGQNIYALETFNRDLTVKTATLNENGETIVTFEGVDDTWTYSQLQTLGVV
jgi:ABC-type uncharacterized transport system auxiliary subunit